MPTWAVSFAGTSNLGATCPCDQGLSIRYSPPRHFTSNAQNLMTINYTNPMITCSNESHYNTD